MAIWPEVPGGGAAPPWDRDGRPAADGWPPGSSFPLPEGTPAGSDAGGGRRRGLALLVLAVAVAGLLASAAGVAVQLLPRSFSAAQQQQITGWEVSARWRAWPAGRIFPPVVRYRVSGSALASLTDLALPARRAGIAPQAGCHSGMDSAAARVLAAHGCQAVLRATYADATSTMAVTVGIAVFPDPAAAWAAARAWPGHTLPGGTAFAAGVRAARFPGTATASFGSAQRQLTWAGSRGPYLIVADAGYADGRPRVRESTDPYALTEMRSLAEGVAASVGSQLAAAPPPPSCPGTPGC